MINRKLYVGVDMGNTGAVAVWDGESHPVIHPFPVDSDGEMDAEKLYEILNRQEPLVVIYEQVFKPLCLVRKQGAMDTFCKLRGVDFHQAVPVVTWKKRILSVNSGDKQISIAHVKAKWPGIDLRRSARSRTDWHDAADSCCLAEYAQLLGA